LATEESRCRQAENAAAAARAEAHWLRQELEHLRRHAALLGRELAAAEIQLLEDGAATAESEQTQSLHGRRVLYVVGRPSSMPAIRAWVQRHGGEFQRHDGGLENRKGLLESALAWAALVLFPVDCIDHDAVARLKRLCTKQGTPYIPLRNASVASFAAAIADIDDTRSPGAEARRPVICLRSG
jgi:hypothetical protein